MPERVSHVTRLSFHIGAARTVAMCSKQSNSRPEDHWQTTMMLGQNGSTSEPRLLNNSYLSVVPLKSSRRCFSSRCLAKSAATFSWPVGPYTPSLSKLSPQIEQWPRRVYPPTTSSRTISIFGIGTSLPQRSCETRALELPGCPPANN